jgi:hypothetical protein
MHYFVGWDVGGWNCEKNKNSRDALAVLGDTGGGLKLCGKPYRGNIRPEINRYSNLPDIVNAACKTTISTSDHITLAIDTPLGMPDSFFALLTGGEIPESIPESYAQNPYLYRRTEQWLFQHVCPPLSAVKDMIGSQATKGMHLLRKLRLTPDAQRCGVWTCSTVTAIETYPTPCKRSHRMTLLFANLNIGPLGHQDRIDAVYCALVAHLFHSDGSSLIGPQVSLPPAEGWIWIPADAVRRRVPEKP